MATTQKTTIKAKVIRAGVEEDGQSVITVEFQSGKTTWQKSYSYFTTQIIKEADFKVRIKTDIKKDLQVKGQLSQIEPLIGKEFTFEV